MELVLSAARLSPETTVIRLPSAARPGRGASVCRTASRSRGHAFAIATATAGSEASELSASGGALGGEVYLAARSEAETERWMAALRAALAAQQQQPVVATVGIEGLEFFPDKMENFQGLYGKFSKF